MKFNYRWVVLLAFVVLVAWRGLPAHDEAAAATEAAADPAVAELQAGCAAATEAIAARQSAATLYDRLGGRKAIHTVITDVVRRHRENPTIVHLMEGVDDTHLIDQVTDFISRAAGGDVAYDGLDMAAAHAHMNLTDEHFLSAGGDVQAALEAAGIGPDEIQEVMCMFASLRGEVVRG